MWSLQDENVFFLAEDGKGEGGGGQHDPNLISNWDNHLYI